jgi:hypothetical protein
MIRKYVELFGLTIQMFTFNEKINEISRTGIEVRSREVTPINYQDKFCGLFNGATGDS